MAIECYFDKCKFHASHGCKDAEECEGPICFMRECVRPAVNRFLTEGLLGKCWHDLELVNYVPGVSGHHVCKKCESRWDLSNKGLFTGDGFFLLLEAAKKQVSWRDFVWWCFPGIILGGIATTTQLQRACEVFVVALNSTENFPILLAEYLGWKEDE